MLPGAKGFLIDLDGVVHIDGHPLPGAGDLLVWLASQGIPYLFLSNTTTRTASQLADWLSAAGLPIRSDQILGTVSATRAYINALSGTPRLRLLVDPRIAGEFADYRHDDVRPTHIVIGDIGRRWDYDLMNQLMHQVQDGAFLIAMHKGRYWLTEGELRIDIGAFVSALEYAADTEATVIGKPSRHMFLHAAAEIGLAPADLVMVGDDPMADICGAQAAGMRAVLVQTGKTQSDQLTELSLAADAVIPSLAALPGLLA